ncbi:hypothetical protein B5807_10389 [Epicoccum nigrum]|uniref:Uncharacterized protein n=1 Tax=Epicoccum nigrum TaxID=105696 RepID=A0A1Y2LQ38_EPING|nr:hypothetical protein B5807_10389 [Epicoccum nigrum]
MRFQNVSLLLITSLGLTQALVIPVPDITAVEKNNASTELNLIMARAAKPYTCPLKDSRSCTKCGKITFKKGKIAPAKPAPKLSSPAPKPVPCKKGTKGCKRDQTQDISKRGPSVPMDKTSGTPWGDGGSFGTYGLGSCSFVVVFDKDYAAGSHIPPARMDAAGELTTTGVEVINDHMGQLDGWLPLIKGPRNCLILTATVLGADTLQHIKNKLAEKGLKNCTPMTYDAQKSTKDGEGVFFLHRTNNVWPPRIGGDLKK